MFLCRFQPAEQPPRIGLVDEARRLVDLSAAGVRTLTSLLELPASAFWKTRSGQLVDSWRFVFDTRSFKLNL